MAPSHMVGGIKLGFNLLGVLVLVLLLVLLLLFYTCWPPHSSQAGHLILVAGPKLGRVGGL